MLNNNRSQGEAGFTVVELAVVILISAILMTVVYVTSTVQQRNYKRQDQVVEIQQNLRSAIAMLSKDIRMAGFDPLASGNFGFVDYDHTPVKWFCFDTTPSCSGIKVRAYTGPDNHVPAQPQMSFTADYSEDGNLDYSTSPTIDSNKDGTIDGSDILEMGDMEQVSWRFYVAPAPGTKRSLQRWSSISGGGGSGWQDMAVNIEAVEFNYILQDLSETQNPTASELSKIRTVQVSILARSAKEDQREYLDTKVFQFASGNFVLPDGAGGGLSFNAKDILEADNDEKHYRRKMIVLTVQCRNMGLGGP